MRAWLQALAVQTLFIEPGSPWENGYVESFNGKLRVEAFVAEPAVERFDVGVLVRLARLDKAKRDPAGMGPRQHGADELLDREIFFTLTDNRTDLDRTVASAVQQGATAQCAGLSSSSAQGGHADTAWRVDHELSSLIRTGTTTGGRS